MNIPVLWPSDVLQIVPENPHVRAHENLSNYQLRMIG